MGRRTKFVPQGGQVHSNPANNFWKSYICISFFSGTCMREDVGTVVSEAVVRRFFVEKVFLEILQNSQENTRARASFLIKLQASSLIKKRDSGV